MVLGADCAVAFVGDSSDSFMHVGRSDVDAPATPSKLIEREGVHQAMQLMPPGTVDPSQGLVPAPQGSEAIWERGGGRPGQELLWLLSLSSTDAVHGFVLVAASEDRVRKWLAAPNECRSLAGGIAMSLGLAQARLEAERMSEELLDLNRRLTTTQRRLVLARSLATVGRMAAGAAHELNNPLSVISGRAQMELAYCDREDSAETLRVIIEQTRRATDIVTDLMRFAKPEPPQPRDQLLSEVLEPLCQHWRRCSSLSVVQLAASLGDPESTVHADPTQLRQALDAVLANAVEATDAETARVQVNSPSRASDETVRIVVEDNGTGMTREVVQHAFDPFFSSRPAGRGRGLGLSRAYRLIEINGGRMWIDSTPQVGTTVTLELPARAPATA